MSIFFGFIVQCKIGSFVVFVYLLRTVLVIDFIGSLKMTKHFVVAGIWHFVRFALERMKQMWNNT